MLKLLVAFVVSTVGLFLAIQANAGIVSWQEEVQLTDGRVIAVEQKRRCPDLPCTTAPEAWLTINLPELSSQPILWHEKLNPRILNTQKGVLYLVAVPPTLRESKLYGSSLFPYVPFRYESGRWKLIGIEEIPVEIYDVNMLIQSVPPDGTQLLTIDQKLGPSLNGRPWYEKEMKRIDLANLPNERRHVTNYSATPAQELSMAIQDSDIDSVRSAIKAGASAKSLDMDGFAPLISAAIAAGRRPKASEPLRIIDLLMDAGADIEKPGPVTPLDVAVRSGPPHVVAYLLEKGANVNAGIADGRTALYQATRLDSAIDAEVLIRHRANVNTKTAEGWAPLHFAAVNGMDSTVRLLLECGADINARDKEGKTPLAWAKGNGLKLIGGSRAKPELIELLIRNGAVE